MIVEAKAWCHFRHRFPVGRSGFVNAAADHRYHLRAGFHDIFVALQTLDFGNYIERSGSAGHWSRGGAANGLDAGQTIGLGAAVGITWAASSAFAPSVDAIWTSVKSISGLDQVSKLGDIEPGAWGKPPRHILTMALQIVSCSLTPFAAEVAACP